MSEISVEIGKKIRVFRKSINMTLTDLSEKIYKSKSTISKYEKGEISIDLETLYDIADALNVHVEQLLCQHNLQSNQSIEPLDSVPGFFKGLTQFYSYVYDGRSNQILRCVFDVLAETDRNRSRLMMYMNYTDLDHYQQCENTYWGYIVHYHALTNIELTNQESPMEQASAHILASYLDAPTKWGLFNGFSTRPMMPISVKMLFSKKPLKEDEALLKDLKVNREDIRLLKLYNMMCVI